MALQDLVEQPETVVLRHLHVAEHERQVVSPHHLQGRVRAVRLPDAVPFLPKHGREHFAHGAIVVDHQHRGRLRRGTVPLDR